MFQHDKFPCVKIVVQNDKICVKHLKRPAQRPDLNPTQHPWDELEH